ncbi:putative DNA polymerase sigma [Rosellinia necatrix]|uniref:polynucleotide adenylyltransferase n=1 Tax=Rosellinia necatrix TaxID=77044 RepID=A0A1W2TMC5_ROSNE|nr:putative DNA polymerase sigma [Rosellinia necatrix]
MYRNTPYTSSSSGPPPHPQPPPGPGYDQYNAYPPPPPPTSLPPPPPLPSQSSSRSRQQWDRRDNRHDGRDGRDARDARDGRDDNRDSYYPRDRPDDHRFRGPFSDLRQPRGSYQDSRDYRDSRDRRGSWDSRDDYRPPRGEFTFRQEAPGDINSYRQQPYPLRSHDDRRAPDSYANRHDGSRRMRGPRPAQPRRTGPYQRREREKAADRLLLSKRFDDESELMLGNTAVRATYRDVDELSDSDEVDMDISDNGDSDSNAADRPAKRQRTDLSAAAAAQDAPKKWSNPDPYTALPPPESTRKKDVVQLIRKARVQAEAQKPAVSSEAADFISCDFSDDDGTANAQDRVAETVQPSAPSRLPDALLARSYPSSSSLPPKPPTSASASASASASHHAPLLPSQKAQTTQSLPLVPLGSANSSNANSSSANLSNANSSNNAAPAPTDLAPSASLGNRKRTIDDEIKLPAKPPHAPLKKVNRMPSGGVVSLIWKPVSGQDPCPWAVDDHSGVPNMGTRLHFEIRDFYDYVRPRDFEERVRRELVSNLEALIRKKWRDAKILPFGSFMSGLYLPTADMDIAVCSQSFINGGHPLYDRKKCLFQLRSHLEIHKVAFRNMVEPITKAKVPLLKYTDDYTGLKVDISFEKMDGYRAVDTFRKWRDQYPAMPPLVAVIKQFLLMRALNEPVSGGIGGFSVICMVVHLLQMMPEVQSRSMGDEHLGQLLMEFLDYYGNKFNYEKVAIRMDPPGTVNKARASTLVYRNLDRLSIIDPNNPENDISGGSSNYAQVKNCFANAYDTLQKTMRQLAQKSVPTSLGHPKNTLLYPLFGGNYSHFQDQRNWLQKMDREGLPQYETPARANAADYNQW